jgi:hypothetical protein
MREEILKYYSFLFHDVFRADYDLFGSIQLCGLKLKKY